jgi:dipeptidyl aminopeptidase/acylaminoacyl peptidase
MDLDSEAVARIASVKSMQVPAKGGPWVAYSKEARPEEKKTDEKKAGEKEAEDRKPDTPAKGTPKKEYGTDLVLRDLTRPDGNERVFANVLEYSFARDGKTLLYAVSSKKEEENGAFAVAPGSDAAPVALLAGKGKYAKLAWDREQTQAAFVSDREDAAAKVPKFKVYRWQRGTPAAAAVVAGDTAGFSKELAVSDKGSLGFSRDGRNLYVSSAAPPKAPKDPDADGPSDEKVLADLWHWKDDLVQPMQRIRANQERNRTYRGVFHIGDGTYVQLAQPGMRTVVPTDDGARALGLDDAPYRRMIDYDGVYADVYLVDAASGSRKLVVKQLRGGLTGPGFGEGELGVRSPWSPDGKFAFYYNDKQWHLLDAADVSARNVTASLGVAFHDEDHDTPEPPGPYGNAGWTKDSRSFLVYDRYDVWQIFTDGRPARNLSRGEGRKSKTALRVARIEPIEEGEEERGIDSGKPLTLRGESEETRATGFFRVSFDSGTPLERLLWGEKNYCFAGRAKDADVLLLTASRFDEYPDLYTTDSSFRSPAKATSGGAQMTPFLWGRSELIRFKNADGVPLSAALYKPENFDPKKKYPMLVYIYERLSQNVNNFVEPRPGHNINIAYYVSNGYLILTPDIVYTIGSPGPSALQCVLPAVQAVVDRGFVDENAIGIQGHSWGGYQTAYMITQTRRFRAAEAGAPVGNMTSAYSGIRWGSGLPRQFQYEQSQSRIARPLYEAPQKFIENSPIFHIEGVKTPLLILHDDNDDAVPWYQGIELFLALRRNGKEAYLFNYNGEFHGLRRRHDQKDYTVRMQQFFDHFLKGTPAPAWMEKGIPFLDREEEKERFREGVPQ